MMEKTRELEEAMMLLVEIDTRMERWLRSGIEAGVKGRDKDYGELKSKIHDFVMAYLRVKGD